MMMYKFIIEAVILVIGIVTLSQLPKSTAINLKEISPFGSDGKTTFKFRLDYIEFSPKDKMFDYGSLRIRKFNRTTYVLDGSWDVLIPITDDMRLNVVFYAFQGNEYRKLGERSIPYFCTEMQLERFFLPDAIKHTNVNPNLPCPFPKMRITINNYVMPGLPSFYVLGNRFRANLTIIDADDTVLASYAAYIVKEN